MIVWTPIFTVSKHTPPPKVMAKTLTMLLHNELQYCFILLESHISWESHSLFQKMIYTQTLHVNAHECVRTFPYVGYNCDQVASSFYRGNSFPRLSGVRLGDFWISFTGTNHYWISRCGETDQSVRGITTVTMLLLLVGKFHDTYKTALPKYTQHIVKCY